MVLFRRLRDQELVEGLQSSQRLWRELESLRSHLLVSGDLVSQLVQYLIDLLSEDLVGLRGYLALLGGLVEHVLDVVEHLVEPASEAALW